MNQLCIDNSILELFVGELTKASYDAIVLNSNSRLLPSGELRCKTLREAGSTVQVECNKIMLEISQIDLGRAVITSSGNLPCKHIIHCRAGHDPKNMMHATWNSLKLADENKLESLVFPPLLSDFLSTKKCANIMLPIIQKYLVEKNNNLKNISICLENLPDFKDFEVALNHLSD
jgi:O-acetyl-ADP-ribose deacetylase